MTDIEKAEFEDVLRRLAAKCEELAAENAKLRSSENTAHSVLREVYNDPSASPHVRVLAAKAAISHESAPLRPQSAPLELTAERKPLPLAEVVRCQRARADALQRNGRLLPSDDPKYREWTWNDNETMSEQVARLTGGNSDGQDGNGGGDDTAGS
jgi:hypothetical protein